MILTFKKINLDFDEFLTCDDLPSCEIIIKKLKDKNLMKKASKDIDKKCTEKFVNTRQVYNLFLHWLKQIKVKNLFLSKSVEDFKLKNYLKNVKNCISSF